MTRRRFYAPRIAFALDNKTVTLSADEARHARDVLRLDRGDEVFVFDGEGREYRCAITEMAQRSLTLEFIEETQPTQPESSLDLTLAVALLKGEKFDLVVQKATELGVTKLVPVITARADVRIREPQDAVRKIDRWQRIALEATKQCGRARLMQVAGPVEFAEFIQVPQNGELRLMFAERNGEALTQTLGEESLPSSTVALVGSEGGWTDYEIDSARSKNWRIVTLGGRTLRAETAAIVVTTLLQHRFGDLT